MRPDYLAWFGRPVFDADGGYVGTVGDVFVDEAEQPVWVEVQAAATNRLVIVPFAGATASESGVQVPHPRDRMMSAPSVQDGSAPSPRDEQLLRSHYATGAPSAPSAPSPATAVPVSEASELAGHDDGSLVRAEEELRITTEIRPTGTVRLRKWVETQTVSEEVVLHQERVRVERQPVGLGDLGGGSLSAEIGEALYEVVLRDEQVVATKVTVPREIVRLTTHVVPETVVVEADLRHEEVAVEGAGVAEPLAGRS